MDTAPRSGPAPAVPSDLEQAITEGIAAGLARASMAVTFDSMSPSGRLSLAREITARLPEWCLDSPAERVRDGETP